MTKKDNIAIKSLIIGLVIMFIASVIGGCTTLYIFHEIGNSGHSIRRIIYTDNVLKYSEGQTLVETIKLSGSTTYTFSHPEKMCAIETGKANTYDIIISTDTSLEGVTGIGYTTEFAMFLGGDYSMATLDNSYIFSGRIGAYAAGGGGQCLTPNCTCGHLYDVFDRTCMHYISTYYVESETQLSMEDVKSQMGITCDGCYTITETTDGTKYYYQATDACLGMKYIHDGTFTRPLMKCIVFNLSGQISQFRYDELVLDGYDFTPLYNYVTTTDYGSVYTNWEQYYNPGDFSHMFSDLPVKKITIKNVKGLGERAKDLSSLFENCQSLEEVEFGNFFEGCKPTDISNMFLNCPKLKSADLSTLDTSEVTNMSNMFATGRPGLYISNEARTKIINSYINETIIPMYLPELNDGRVWTYDTFFEEMSKDPNFSGTSKEEGLFLLVFEYGLNITLTYDELSMAIFNMPFTELVIKAIENPTAYELPAKNEGETYTYKEIIDYYKSTLSMYGINDPMFDGLLNANSSREELINYAINEVYVPLYLDPDDDTKYTLDTIVAKLNEVQTFSDDKLTKEEFLFNLVYETGIPIPLTWDEVTLGVAGMKMSEVVKLANLNPEEFGLEPKVDGSPYTEEDIINKFDAQLEFMGINAVTNSELESIYNGGGAPEGKLILGGENSKFVVNEGTNVSGMFGTTNNFSSIVAPASIHESITIELPYLYTNGADSVGVVQHITSTDANKQYGYYEEPEPQTEKGVWLSTGEIVAISVGGGSVILGCIVALVLVIVVKKKPASRY